MADRWPGATPSFWCSLPILALAMAACTTTGDPTQGGLVGWSSEKALQRQQQLQIEADRERNRALDERRRADALQGQERHLEGTVLRLQAQMAELEAENLRLERQLGELVGARNLREAEVARLLQVLRQSKQTRADLASAAARRAASEPPTEDQLSAVDNQNRLLHREVMQLLGR